MKKFIIVFTLFLALFSCVPAGTSVQKITGLENELPLELKGLKVYKVSTGGLGEVKVGILNNQVISTTYPIGKYQESLILVTPKRKSISVTILSENDSIIVARKN